MQGQPVTVATARTHQQIASLPVDQQLQAMRKSIRSWAWVTIVMGVISLIANQFLAAPWGVVQIMIGLLSFVFYSDYPMFLIYASMFIMAGIMNLLSGSLQWSFGGLLQFFWAFSNVQLYRMYRKAAQQHALESTPPDLIPDNPNAPPPLWGKQAEQENSRAQRYFPWLSFGLGCGGTLLSAILFMGGVVLVTLKLLSSEFLNEYGVILTAAIFISLMAFPFGVAALISNYDRSHLSIIGILMGGLMLAALIGLTIMGRNSNSIPLA